MCGSAPTIPRMTEITLYVANGTMGLDFDDGDNGQLLHIKIVRTPAATNARKELILKLSVCSNGTEDAIVYDSTMM